MVAETEHPEASPTPTIVIVPAEAWHVRELRQTMREKDKEEIQAVGISVDKSLWYNFKKGIMNRTALVDGKVAAMWGCGGSWLGAKAAPWLLTSPEIYKVNPLRVARIYQKEVYNMLKFFPTLENYALASYNQAIRLLMIAGFEIGEPEKIRNGTFRKFTMRAKV